VPLLADIAAHGLERVLESGRADHERRSIVQAWIAVGTWEESANTATRSAHPRSGNSSPRATLPMSGSIWPSSSSSTTYRLMGSSRSLRILPARLMLPLRRRSRRSLAPTQTARPGGRQETNVPRSDRKRQVSWRYGHRPGPAAGLAGAGHDEPFRGGAHGAARRRAIRRTRRESPGGNSHRSASRPSRELEGILAPRARTFAPGSPGATGSR
jgi:hypothetical protein